MMDDRFERDLAAALAARDPGAVPATLTARVMAIPDPRVGGLRRLRGRLAGLAAAVAALVAIGAVVQLRRPAIYPAEVGPGAGTGQPGPIPFDPAADGSGVYTGSSGGEIVAILVVTTLVAVAALVLIRRGGRKALAIGGAMIGVAAIVALGAIWINADEPLESTGMILYPGLGSVEDAPSGGGGSAGADDVPTLRFVVEPNGVFAFGFDVHNRGSVPITVLGIVPDRRHLAFGRFTAAGWMGGTDGIGTVPPEQFTPMTLAPGGYQVLMVAARGSPCAVASTASRSGAQVSEVQIAYSTLGIVKVATVRLPWIVSLALDPACDWNAVSSPGP